MSSSITAMMAPAARLLGPFEAVASHSGLRYVCSTCRRQPVPRAAQVVVHNAARRHNSSTPLSEKVRRKLWGTDNPPGLKDPYGGEGALEKTFRRNREASNAQLEQRDAEGAEEEAEMEVEVENEHNVPTAPPRDYTPATTWEGLERVGYQGHWTDLPKPETEKTSIKKFFRKQKLGTREQLTAALHQAFVEICMVKRFNKNQDIIYDVRSHKNGIQGLLDRVEIKIAEDGSLAGLVFPGSNEQQKLEKYFYGKVRVVTKDTKGKMQNKGISSTGAVQTMVEESTPGSKNVDFLSFSLDADPSFKFMYLKRVTQLTGHPIPDSRIALLNSPSQVLKVLVDAAKPKPKTIAEQLLAESKLTSLPNVKIFDKRQTPIHREIEVGRWKVIEEELTVRGLPVTGTQV